MRHRFIFIFILMSGSISLASCGLRPSTISDGVSSDASSLSDAPTSILSESKRFMAYSSGGVPAAYALDVPFVAQAPLQDWTDELNEACEEASLLNVEYYLRGKALPAPEEAEKMLYDMIAWEEENGYKWDMTTAEVAEMAEIYFQRDATVFKGSDVTAKKIKSLIAAGHPVIIPAAGQMLGNPYFSGDGPPYHMLVITGYDVRGFIANDVGTKRGAGYRYPETTIMNAIHDWTGDTATITRGEKAILIVE